MRAPVPLRQQADDRQARQAVNRGAGAEFLAASGVAELPAADTAGLHACAERLVQSARAWPPPAEATRFPHEDSTVVGVCGPNGLPMFWLNRGTSAETRELHLAFCAPDRPAVDAVHKAAVEVGAEVLHAPRERPQYHPGHYGVLLRDLDGHNVETLYHGDHDAHGG